MLQRAQGALAANEYGTALYWFQLVRTWDPALVAAPLAACEAACAAPGHAQPDGASSSKPVPAQRLPVTLAEMSTVLPGTEVRVTLLPGPIPSPQPRRAQHLNTFLHHLLQGDVLSSACSSKVIHVKSPVTKPDAS